MSEQPKLVQTAPERLWLCVSDDPADTNEPFPNDLSEVTWATDHCPVACGVTYVRADLWNSRTAAAFAVRENELTALRARVEELESKNRGWEICVDAAIQAMGEHIQKSNPSIVLKETLWGVCKQATDELSRLTDERDEARADARLIATASIGEMTREQIAEWRAALTRHAEKGGE